MKKNNSRLTSSKVSGGLNESQNSISESTKKVKLIDGKFSKQEAVELLLRLLNDKINTHHLRNFSSITRFGNPESESIKRIEILMQEKEALTEFFNQPILEDKKFLIRSTIHLSIID
jgi:hypothetical protein